jgi:hypothetical protein
MAELDNPEVQPEEDYNLVKQARIIWSQGLVILIL